ncbi:uncharacterized protein METZ01_LOCUS225365, partial [marine metagenome]
PEISGDPPRTAAVHVPLEAASCHLVCSSFQRCQLVSGCRSRQHRRDHHGVVGDDAGASLPI